MKRSTVRKSALAGLLWACAGLGQAGVLTQTLADFSSSDADFANYPLSLNIGSFSFSGAGTINSATISGTFGNAAANTSTEVVVFGDGIEIAYCSLFDDCSTNGQASPVTPWSYTFSGTELASLADGALALSVSKEFEGWVRLGSLTLALDVTEVPEPASTALVLAGLAGLGWSLRRRRPQS